MKPTVQIVCITYNQEAYIAQALASLVAQQTDFPFEIIVADDRSTDGTPRIIQEFHAKYPALIRPIFQETNLGAAGNFLDALNRVEAEFLALCEGDDYWTDPSKLQKQHDALRAHPECAVCFHPVRIIDEGGAVTDERFPAPQFRFNKTRLQFADLAKRNFIQTNAVMYRWQFQNQDLRRVYSPNILPGDWFIHLVHAHAGDILFLEDVMSVYRIWSGGIWNGAGKSDAWFSACGIPSLRFYRALHGLFPQEFPLPTLRCLEYCDKILAAARTAGRQDLVATLEREFPEFLCILPRYRILLRLRYFCRALKNLPAARRVLRSLGSPQKTEKIAR